MVWLLPWEDSQLYYGSEIGMSGDKDKGDVFAKISQVAGNWRNNAL
jgi:hypothetical protein